MTLTAPEATDQPFVVPLLWKNVIYLINGRRIEGCDEFVSEQAARNDHSQWFVALMEMTGKFKIITGGEVSTHPASDYFCCVQVPVD